MVMAKVILNSSEKKKILLTIRKENLRNRIQLEKHSLNDNARV
jgi:hypothetical protein